MNDKEYTYNIDKYTIGVDENGKDEIGLTIAIIKNGEINFLGNYYGENARCIDLLIKENQELKKQLEEIEKCLKDMYHINIENDKELEKLKTQQKGFINFLEDNYKETQDIWYIKVLQKYKSIIGDDK